MTTNIKSGKIMRVLTALLILMMVSFTGCEDYLETEQPIDQLSSELVFEDETIATSAVTSMYAKLRDDLLVSGGYYGLGVLMGLYSDELDFYGIPGSPLEGFYAHQILPTNDVVGNIWNGSYNLIYMSNSVLEGLENSQNLSEVTKQQLKGEALFIRAFTHFYLVNLFGDIPHINTTNYLENKDVSREPANRVYEKILYDLENAEALLTEEYITGERIRANRYVIHAMKARVYAYTGDWHKAEIESGKVINHTALYLAEPDLTNEFLKESRSAILQLKPATEGENTHEGMVFNFSYGPPHTLSLSNDLINSMEENDLRRAYWVAEITEGEETWYASTKYQYLENTGNSLEYSIILRVPEQYLIRAEARLKQGNVQGAVDDINILRSRAGLPEVTPDSPNTIMDMIMKERRIELFAEQGHRWFDLKRTGRAGEVLSILKPFWNEFHLLLPLPEVELLINPNLNPQNPGY